MTHGAMERVRTSYDAVAEHYAAAFANELATKPLERGLLDSFAEFCRELRGPIADVGCGPGHVTRYLADRGVDIFGLDLSPAMVEVARLRYPGLNFRVGSMTALDIGDATWVGAVALYSIIHLSSPQRDIAYRELARALRAGGLLLISFHVSTATQPAGTSVHLDTWFDATVDLTGYFLDPDEVIAGLCATGFEVRAQLEREPYSIGELASRRCYLLARRLG